MIPTVAAIEAADPEISVEGGWVYAIGQGPLGSRESTLHRRDQIGSDRVGSYMTVDTGKYSIAPWLARSLVDDILSG